MSLGTVKNTKNCLKGTISRMKELVEEIDEKFTEDTDDYKRAVALQFLSHEIVIHVLDLSAQARELMILTLPSKRKPIE